MQRRRERSTVPGSFMTSGTRVTSRLATRGSSGGSTAAGVGLVEASLSFRCLEKRLGPRRCGRAAAGGKGQAARGQGEAAGGRGGDGEQQAASSMQRQRRAEKTAEAGDAERRRRETPQLLVRGRRLHPMRPTDVLSPRRLAQAGGRKTSINVHWACLIQNLQNIKCTRSGSQMMQLYTR